MMEIKQRAKRKPSVLDKGLGLNGIIIILENTQKPIRYSKLLLNSNIKMKQTFNRYLSFCKDKKLITRKVSKKQSEARGAFKPFVHKRELIEYHINERGLKFLELVRGL